MMTGTEHQPTHGHRDGNVIGTLLLALVILSPLSVLGEEFTAETPEGALYDTRTHYYEPMKQKVLLRKEYKNISGEEKKAAYAELGIQLGPRDLDKWLLARQSWQQTVKERRQQAAELSVQRRKDRRSQPRPLHYYSYSYGANYGSYYRPMTYFDYWHNARRGLVSNYQYNYRYSYPYNYQYSYPYNYQYSYPYNYQYSYPYNYRY